MDEFGAAVGARCWDWLERQRGAFEPFREDDPARARRLLAYGELTGILGGCLRRGASGGAVERLARFVDGGLDAYDWEAQAIRSPAFVVAVLVAARFRTALGGDAEPLRAAAARHAALGTVDALELAPYRMFELEHLLAACGAGAGRERTFAERLRAALAPLGKPPSAYTTHDRYAVTHIVFALCDDGTRAAESVAPAAVVARLRDLVALCGRMALIEREHDLLAESVSCVRYLGMDEPRFVREAFALAAAAQDADGSIPTFAEPPAVEDARFFQRYHATLMWAHAAT
ncbi:MAG TPA: hypothetical protein VGD01_08285 [Candidatus Elarobacter sp.]|jgi:hypothetical protein